MTADLHDVESQPELLLQGATATAATDHVPKGLSTLSQFLLRRQQVLENPHSDQWIMANWQAVRTMAGRLSVIRKHQRPFASLKEPERQRCARYLLVCFLTLSPARALANLNFSELYMKGTFKPEPRYSTISKRTFADIVLIA